MKKKTLIASLATITIMPLTSLVSCNKPTPVVTYTISGGSITLTGSENTPGSDKKGCWVVTNSKGDKVSADLSLESTIESSTLPSWITIPEGKVTWTDEAVKGTYKFKVKATIVDVADPIYSEEITLNINEMETYTISGGSTTLSGEALQEGLDTLKWVVKDSKEAIVPTATLSIEPDDHPNWIQINDGTVKWTNAATAGTYKFKVKAEIEGSEPIYSEEITLTITETYTISGGETTLNGEPGQEGSDSDAWIVTNSKREPVTADLTIEGIEPSSDFPTWITIPEGKVTWTEDASIGTYRFKVKATIEGVDDPIYSEEITLTIYPQPSPTSDFEWTINEDKTATLDKYVGEGGDVVIPPTIESEDVICTVTSIGENAFKSCETITSIVIPNGITSINQSAFQYCSNLTSVTIGKDVKNIHSSAFYSCTALTDHSGSGGTYAFTFLGTTSDWKQVYRAEMWLQNVQATKIRCHDGICGLDDRQS